MGHLFVRRRSRRGRRAGDCGWTRARGVDGWCVRVELGVRLGAETAFFQDRRSSVGGGSRRCSCRNDNTRARDGCRSSMNMGCRGSCDGGGTSCRSAWYVWMWDGLGHARAFFLQVNFARAGRPSDEAVPQDGDESDERYPSCDSASDGCAA